MVKKLIPSFEIVLDAEYIKGNRERNVYADAARWKPWQRQLLQVSALLQNLLAGGAVFGWSSLLPLLQRQGVLSWLCEDPLAGNVTLTTKTNGEVEVCEEQELQFLGIWTAGSVAAMFSGLPWGLLLDTMGPRVLNGDGNFWNIMRRGEEI